MLHIMPTSDLKENFAKIENLVVEQGENVYLTQNGYGSMVIVNLSIYEKMVEGTQNKGKSRSTKKINMPHLDIVDD